MQRSLYQYLKSNLVFKNLDNYAFHVVENYLYFRSLEPGEFLMEEGQAGDFVAFVVLGRLNVIKNGEQGSTILSVIKAGDSIGEMALIDDLSRSASAQAIEKTAVVILPKRDFDRILKDHPRIGIEMLKGLATLLSLNLRRTSVSLSRQLTRPDSAISPDKAPASKAV